jgi:BirA family biotin operon repressor/biotin-[acetyl-CoA-carboxylase] ligase
MRPLALLVLARLSHQHFTSGALLATELGVSRSAVSDALKDAQAQHIEIFSLTRRGYRLAAPLELLDVGRVHQALGGVAPRLDVEIVPVLESTNTALLERAQQGAASGTCLAAEIQTAGRGRRGRKWQSRFAASLTFSLLWRFDKGAAQLGGLSLVVGLAVVRVLRARGIQNAMLKWPNDIVVNDQKLAGILIETSGDMLGPTAAVIGVGINMRLPPDVCASIDQPVTDVATWTPEGILRNDLLAALLRELVSVLDGFSGKGFGVFREEWLFCHALHGKTITVTQGTEIYQATVSGVADDGSLTVVPTPAFRARYGNMVALSSAEISVRRAEPTESA